MGDIFQRTVRMDKTLERCLTSVRKMSLIGEIVKYYKTKDILEEICGKFPRSAIVLWDKTEVRLYFVFQPARISFHTYRLSVGVFAAMKRIELKERLKVGEIRDKIGINSKFTD